jgi:hypothetical protein
MTTVHNQKMGIRMVLLQAFYQCISSDLCNACKQLHPQWVKAVAVRPTPVGYCLQYVIK